MGDIIDILYKKSYDWITAWTSPPYLDDCMGDSIDILYKKIYDSILFSHPNLVFQMEIKFWVLIYKDNDDDRLDYDVSFICFFVIIIQ